MRRNLLWFFGFEWWEEVAPDFDYVVEPSKARQYLQTLKAREKVFELNLLGLSQQEQERLCKQYARLQKQLKALITQGQEGGRA